MRRGRGQGWTGYASGLAGLAALLLLLGRPGVVYGQTTTTTFPPLGTCGRPAPIPPNGTVTGAISGVTSGSSLQSGTCQASTASAPERVYQWTPNVSGNATVSTCGPNGQTAFNTVVYVRSGTCTGTEVACNDDACACADPASCGNANRASSVTFAVTAGTPYFIFVDGAGESGPFSLSVTAPGTCAAPGAFPAGGGSVSASTSGPGILGASCGNALYSPEKVFQWTPNAGGPWRLSTCNPGTNFDTVLYMESTCGDASTTIGCTGTGCYNGRACNDDQFPAVPCTVANTASSGMTVTVTQGQIYYVVVDGYGLNTSGNFTLTAVTVTTAPGATTTTTAATTTSTTTTTLNPCSIATVIASGGGTFQGTTSGGSTLGGTCGTTAGSPEKVYQWTPAVNGVATIQTCGGTTGYDTVLYFRTVCAGADAVIAGCNPGPSPVAGSTCCNDDGSPCLCSTGCGGLNKASRLTPTVMAGQTYFIVVDGYSGASGPFTLTVTPPSGATTTTTTLPSGGGGSVVWAKDVGGTGLDKGYGVAMDGSGNLVMVGFYKGTINTLGGTCGSVTSVSNSFDALVAKYSPSGTCIWVKSLGGTGDDQGFGIATGPGNTIAVTGVFYNTVDFGGGGLVSAGGRDIFVAEYDTNGTYMWAKRFGSSGKVCNGGTNVGQACTVDANCTPGLCIVAGGNDWGYAVAMDHTCGGGSNDGTSCTSNANCTGGGTCGNVFFTGSFEATVNFGGSDLVSNAYGDNLFVAKYAAAGGGTHLWSRTATAQNSSNQTAAIAVSDTGDVAISGIFAGSVDFNASIPSPTTLASHGGYDIFVAKLAGSTGAHLWSKGFGDTSNNDTGNGVAFDRNGDVLLVGATYGTVDFGCGAVSYPSIDGYVAKLSSASGSCTWVRPLKGDYTNGAGGQAVATDATNNVLVSGSFSTALTNNVGIDFGLGQRRSANGHYDMFVAKYTSANVPVWVDAFGGSADEYSRGIAVDGSNQVGITGDFQSSSVVFDATTLTNQGVLDGFLTKLAP